MSLTFKVNGVKKSGSYSSGKYTLSYPCSSKETCYPYESEFPPGKYRFEVHGAAGGSTYPQYTAPGGLSTGTIVLKSLTHLYFYVGAKGVCTSTDLAYTTSVFGGGGRGKNGGNSAACSGGGSSDIRVSKSNLSYRIIVAGGSGGSGYDGNAANTDMIGGRGGGESGEKGEDGSSGNCVGGGPGTQTSGGSSPYNEVGVFGFGGNRTSNNGCGGGGGWFGGGAGGAALSAGGGGSGFVFTKSNSYSDLDSTYLLIEGKTEFGPTLNDGLIYVEYIGTFVQKAAYVIKHVGVSLASKFLSIFILC